MTEEGERAKYITSGFKKRNLKSIVVLEYSSIQHTNTGPIKVPGNGPT